jgi:dihydroflavonol-4-reductase
MAVVVTGAAGHLGGNLVRALLAEGRHVRAMVHRDRRALEGLDVETVVADVRDPATLARAFHGADVVYHCAGYVSILEDEWPILHEINVLGTRNVVEACLQRGVRRLLHFSSIHALELTCEESGLVDESRSLVQSTSSSSYAFSKAEGEREVRRGCSRGLDAVILNPTAMIGPHDYRPSHQGQVLLWLAHGRLPALVNGGFDWVDVRDVVRGAMLAEARAPAGAKYLLSGHWVSARDLAATVEAVTGVRAPRFVCPMFLAQLAAPLFTVGAHLIGVRPLYTRVALDALSLPRSGRTVSHQRAARELGYRPRAFRQTLLDTFEWLSETGRLSRPLSQLSPEVA